MGYYKFFQIFKFFFYGFTSRRNRKLLKILLVCIAIFIGIFWLSENCAFASTMVNENVTESMRIKYDSIAIDFIKRYEKLNDINKEQFSSRFTNPQFGYYLYYGNADGTSCLDSGTNNDTILNVQFIFNDARYTISYSNYTYWFGLQSNHIFKISFANNGGTNSVRAVLNDSGESYTMRSTGDVYIPSELYCYNSSVIYDYFMGNRTLEQIEQQLEQANATLTQIEEDLTDDSFDDTQDNPIDLELFDDYNEDYQDNLFNGVLERFYNNIPNSTSSIYAIHIPIPHSNGQEITLYSNAISKHINYFSQPMLYTFIQACWYVVFFKYFFWFGKKVLDWILTGEVLEKGGGAFIKSLEKENAVINAAMM